ncbi:hypothetical protein [Neoroseomonas lacus]|uniref:Uncharacterized protein n=1 Tax=Neoroseomonas lacus TaxID=287609 RepID=A0A917L5N8_9PROT|nr:hypothetical protein [Neoroseomonas lacus]GGJ40838.1 hypothetical protein GCM10011320_55610 [Neoroseomonas lacus]
MIQGHNTPGAPARLDWFTLSDDLEAVFVAARRVSALARLATTEQARIQDRETPRRVREAWADVNLLLCAAVDDMDKASSHLSAKAAALLGVVMDAEDREP